MSRNRKKLAKIGIPDDKKIILTDSVINKKEHPEINFKYLYKCNVCCFKGLNKYHKNHDILKHYSEAINDFQNKRVTDVLNRVILHIIYTTGLTSVMAKDDYHISLAHGMHHGLTKVKRIGDNLLHGELVSYGILLLLTMDKQYEERENIFRFNKSISLPTCLKDIGINKANLEDEELNSALEIALAGKDLNMSPYKVDKNMILKAIIDLEDFNNKQ